MPTASHRLFSPLLAAAGLLGLAGCATGPSYQAPALSTLGATSTWQTALPHDGRRTALRDWWAQFNDPALLTLIEQAEAGSPTLAQAWAKIEQARATLSTDNANALPSLSASAGSTRSQTQTALSTTRSVGLDASWELDLFGKLKRNSEAAQARVQARVADWHDARVSLAAEVADTYVQYRTCGLLAQAYENELTSVTATERATAARVSAGLSAPSDGALARASLASSRSTALGQQAQCAVLLKTLVYLSGQNEPSVRATLASASPKLPQPSALQVDSVPAQVLRQRPDLASLERELAAASAEIGAAQADLYPSLSLSGSISRARVGGGSSYTAWSFGPQISLPLFDGGQRRAAVASAQASYVSALAGYQQGVRAAVRDVEQALVNLDGANQQASAAQEAASAYRSYFQATEANWRAGTASLLDLEEARRSALSAEVSELSQRQSLVSTWITLYKALGGGWTPDAPVKRPSAADATNAAPAPSSSASSSQGAPL